MIIKKYLIHSGKYIYNTSVTMIGGAIQKNEFSKERRIGYLWYTKVTYFQFIFRTFKAEL